MTEVHVFMLLKCDPAVICLEMEIKTHGVELNDIELYFKYRKPKKNVNSNQNLREVHKFK